MASIKKTKKRLGEARKEARKLAGGQLAAIQSGSNKQLQKQLNKFDKKTGKLIKGMSKFAENQEAVGAREAARVIAQGTKIAGRGSALDFGIVGNRSKQVERDARTLTGTAQVLTRQGKDVKKATGQAFQGMQRAGDAGAGSAATVLEVLEAERRMNDERFIAGLEEERRAQEAQFQHNREMAKLEARLARKAVEGEGLSGDPVASADTLASMANDIVSLSKSDTYSELPLAEKQAQLITAIQSTYGFSEPQDVAAISHLVRRLTTNQEGVAGADEIVSDILSVIRGVPGWEKAGKGKKRDHLKKMLYGKVGSQYEALRGEGPDPRVAGAGPGGKGKGFKNVDFRDSTQIGPVGTWAEYKSANAKSLYPAEERDVAIVLARRRFYNAFKGAHPDITEDRAVNLTDKVIDYGMHFSEFDDLSPKVQRVIRNAYTRLPEDVKKYIRFD